MAKRDESFESGSDPRSDASWLGDAPSVLNLPRIAIGFDDSDRQDLVESEFETGCLNIDETHFSC